MQMIALTASLVQSTSAAHASQTEGSIETSDFKYTYKIESKCGGAPCATLGSDNLVGLNSVGVEICNMAGQEVAIATITLLDRDTNEFRFKGWTRLKHKDCRTFFGPALGPGDVAFFYRAETIGYSDGKRRTWSSQEYRYRVPSTAFSFTTNNHSGQNPLGDERGFRRLRLSPGKLEALNLNITE